MHFMSYKKCGLVASYFSLMIQHLLYRSRASPYSDAEIKVLTFHYFFKFFWCLFCVVR